MQCEEWDDANSELFKESHDEAVHKNSYKSRLYELISASLVIGEEKVLRINGPCGPKVQRVQSVLRVQRVVVGAHMEMVNGEL